MIKKCLLGSALILPTLIATAHADDKVILKNGDKLSGEILSYSQSGIKMQTGFGVLDIDSANIGGVTSDKFPQGPTAISYPHTITNIDPMNPSGAIMTENSDPAPITPEPVVADIVTPAPEPIMDENGLWGAKWSGDANIGGEIETGNSDSTTVDLDASVNANWNDVHRAKLSADYEFEEEDGERLTDDREIAGTYDYFFAKKWFWNNQLKLEQEKVDELDLRADFISGLGYQIYQQDDLNLEITFGPGFEREEYANQDATNNITANWTLGYEQKFMEDFFRLYHNHDLFSPFDDFSSYLFESETGIKIPLRNGIVASGEIEFDWNNDPADGEGEDDTTYGVKLGYEW